MLPTLLHIGPVTLSSFGVLAALALLVGTFLIWQHARNHAISDDKIFDNVIVVVASSVIGARIGFVITHVSLFTPNWLRTFLLWSYPGFSVWGGLVLGGVSFWFYSHKQKLVKAIMFDAYGMALPLSVMLMSLATLLDGIVVGKRTSWPIGVMYPGFTQARHPVGLYGFVLFLIYFAALLVVKPKIPDKLSGIIGWTSLAYFGLVLLVLAIFRNDLLYWEGLPVDIILAGMVFVVSGIFSIMKIHGQNLKLATNWWMRFKQYVET